jgi:hypothetical protein
MKKKKKVSFTRLIVIKTKMKGFRKHQKASGKAAALDSKTAIKISDVLRRQLRQTSLYLTNLPRTSSHCQWETSKNMNLMDQERATYLHFLGGIGFLILLSLY